MTDQTETQASKLAKLARASAAKKYGEALRRGHLTQAIYDELELAEAALVINQQDASKYDAAREVTEEVFNQQWNESCDKAIASANPTK